MSRCVRAKVFGPGRKGLCHVYGQTVRRQRLMGTCEETGRSYDHRREWVKERDRCVRRLGYGWRHIVQGYRMAMSRGWRH